MASTDGPDRLYDLLPAIHRIRDAEQGYTLRALLRLIGREADILQQDLWQLYDGWFIETCPEWLVPYIGDLIGYVPAPAAGDPDNLDVSDPQTEISVLVPRRDVANTIRDRRRKGTLALFEEIARDTAGWPAHAVEFFHLLGWTQNINYLRPHKGGTTDLRHGSALAQLGGAFDTLAHSVDVRRPNSTLRIGRHNIPAVGLFAWRLRAYTVIHSRADCVEQFGPNCYTFSALGNDTPLFNLPPQGAAAAPVSSVLDLPVPITRRMLADHGAGASAALYGLDKSLAIWAPDWPVRGTPQPLARETIAAADLSTWQEVADHVAVDPQLGRIVFPSRHLPRGGVAVSYAYGFAAPIGGGEYDRPLREAPGSVVYTVSHDGPDADTSLQAALQRWRGLRPRPKAAVIEIIDSGVYSEALSVELDQDEILQIRAAVGARPVLRLLDYTVDRPDAFQVRGRRGSCFTLDGLLISGRGLMIQALDPQDGPDGQGGQDPQDDLCEVVIRHCTLVPGWGLHCDCEPTRPTEAGIELLGSRPHLQIEHTILGSIVVYPRSEVEDPVKIDLSDSILDCAGRHDGPDGEVLAGPSGQVAAAVASFRRCTVFGQVRAQAMALAENSIFTGPTRIARRNFGCMRFCYAPPGSRTPPRYECQPDRVMQGLTPDAAALEALRVRPLFMSVRYGTPDYARLSDHCAVEIRRGADDQSEMGVYHDLFEPQREALLRQRLQDFTPAGSDAGLIFVS
jgi:hypothetical protein